MKIFTLLFIPIILSSCVSTKRINTSNNEIVNPSDFNTGIFSNCPINECNNVNRSLVDNLTFKFINKDTLDNWQELKVQLTKHDKALGIKVYDKDSLIVSNELRGKWKNNSFYSKRMIRPIGVPFIYYWYYEKKIIIEWTNETMIISKGEAKFGMIFIINAGVTDYTWIKYKRINTANKG
tara:strand:- start:1360 stop:1899 length:540 start_codon:yes stop_codon:yes gene_type:complete